ncbi:hypothetical protein [Fuerstiella marisgermanici]|uniref:Acyl carrier protein phosphodiesterase n=1 Tax=Fuerstiella marisgermanici TaxID=1891926 RepID=A0A1P8WD89_9PLAN|nr:hypothetical protein [Fuerstiella marisgermanici]APZ92014.1 hypothetical protein Fuma_01615 [Fuerstiella marisgermanici]
MNFLAHGYKYLDRPLFMAGTAVPDWLSVIDRKVRARSRLVAPVVEASNDPQVREIGLGILQHHADDDIFHRCALFQQLEAELSSGFRRFMPDRYDHRPGFLGHITVELLLDATLAAADTSLLDRYYDVLAEIDAVDFEAVVNTMTTRPTDKLVRLIAAFRKERFLDDYFDDERLLYRLNQVLHRVKLPAASDDVIEVLAAARDTLTQRGPDLLKIVANGS